MLFNSHVFLFAFLPIVLIGFYLLASRAGRVPAQIWLTAASFVFYAWSGWRVLPLLVVSILVNFVVGRSLVGLARQHRPYSLLLTLGVAFNLLLLGYFKYAGFLSSNLVELAGLNVVLGNIVLPIGISFYTFTQIAFLVDAARGQAQEYDLPRYALFVTFFPHLIAGPIIHHKEMMPQFADPKTYIPKAENFSVGLTLFAMGLFKKVAIADRIAPFASPVFFAADHGALVSFGDAWMATIAYALQIYFDFSAYSDMAIGLARMFGINLPLNFNSPYKSLSIIEFWRRWHMTLSRFLRDYVYFSLGGNRKGPLLRYVNLMVTMLLGGLWHGAGWTFVVWGGLHGLYLVINHLWRATGGRMPAVLAWCVTFAAVLFAWVFFRAQTFSGAVAMLHGMSGASGVFAPDFNKTYDLALLMGLVAFAGLAPNTQQIMRAFMPREFYEIAAPAGPAAAIAWQPTGRVALTISAVLIVAILLMPKASQFLYFQF